MTAQAKVQAGGWGDFCVVCRAQGKPDVPTVEPYYCADHLTLEPAAQKTPKDSASQAGSSTKVGQGSKEPRKSRAKKGFSRSHKDSNTEESNGADPVEKRMAEVEHLLEHHAAGKFEPERIELRPLPDGASGTMRAVYEFYGLVLSLRVDAGMDDPYEVLFAHRWVADKIGRPRETVQRALKRLVGAGVLEEPKTADAIPGKRPTHIYAPVPVRHLTALPDPKQDEIERRAA